MKAEIEQIVLNLSYNYPVKWGTLKVLVDFIQNFYDAAGYDNFHKQFVYSYENNVLTMSLDNHPFELDWLLYMGASTKRNGSRYYAGCFGEGFKIAALISRRDFNWDIVMESKDWRIQVSEAIQTLEDREISMLAYEKTERADDNKTILTLSGVSETQYEAFQECMCEFFYRENPLFGECIEEGDGYAVYRTKEGAPKGAVYASLLKRQSIPVPLFFCYHSYRGDRDRDRSYFGEWATRQCISSVIYRMQEENILLLLEIFEQYWLKTRQGRSMDMGETLKLLIRMVAGNPMCRQQFMEKYGKRLLTNNVNDFAKGRVEQQIALRWYRSSEYSNNTTFVIGEFSKLGVKSLDTLCREKHGYITHTEADEREQLYINILSRAAKEIFGDLICYDDLPECKVIINEKTQVLGEAHMQTNDKHQANIYGMKPKYNPQFITIQKSVLHTGSFPRAIAVYMHELLHQYGDDVSMHFRKALLYMNQLILHNLDELIIYQKEWDSLEVTGSMELMKT